MHFDLTAHDQRLDQIFRDQRDYQTKDEEHDCRAEVTASGFGSLAREPIVALRDRLLQLLGRQREAAMLGVMQALFKRVASLPDRRMRTSILREALSELSPSGAARVLDEGLRLQRGESELRVLDALSVVTFASERAIAIRDAAVGLDLHLVAEWVAPRAAQEAPASEPHRDLADVPLGYRKTMARSGARAWVERLLRETVPGGHRRVAAQSALARKPMSWHWLRAGRRARRILALVHGSSWGTRQAVKRSLAFNPSTPPALVLKIVPLLLRQECVRLANEPGIDARVTAAARERASG